MENEEIIKQKRGFYWYYLTFPACAFFILVNYFSKNFKVVGLDAGLMISVSTFLFGFLISISFSMLLSRSSSLKSALAGETGRIISLYLLSKHLGKSLKEKLEVLFDSYTINTLREYKDYSIGRETFYNVYENIKLAEIKTEFQKQTFNSFMYILGEWEVLRENLEYLTKKRALLWSLKCSNYLLGFIVIALLFLNRSDLFTNILFIILSTVIIFVLLIIEDYDELRIGDYTANISNSEQIFDLMGKDRYYPFDILGRVRLENGKKYRIGIYDSSTKREKIVLMTYSLSFGIRLTSFMKKFSGREGL